MAKGKKFSGAVVMGLPLLIAVGAVGVFYSTVHRSRTMLDEEIAAARKVGMPVEREDIPQPVVKESENAAPIYEKLIEVVHGEENNAYKAVSKVSEKNPTPAQIKVAEEALPQLDHTWALLDQLPKYPSCQFARDWSKGAGVTFPEYSYLKSFTQLLCFKADVLSRRGDWKEATRLTSLAQKVAVDAGREPVIIGMLVRVAAQNRVIKELEVMADRHQSNPVALDAIEKVANETSAIPDVRWYVGGEIAFGHAMMKGLKNINEISSGSGPSSLTGVATAMKLPGGPEFFEAKYLQRWRATWVRMPTDPANWQTVSQVLTEHSLSVDNDQSFSNALNRVICPVFSGMGDSVGTMQAENHLLLTSIEMLKIRDRAGKMPAAVPQSLGAIRLDPFDGAPLRYRREGKGFMLYSIGQDRVDNGGERPKRMGMAPTYSDQVLAFK